MKLIIDILDLKIKEIKKDLIENPMTSEERLRKVIALDKIDDAIKLLLSIDL